MEVLRGGVLEEEAFEAPCFRCGEGRCCLLVGLRLEFLPFRTGEGPTALSTILGLTRVPNASFTEAGVDGRDGDIASAAAFAPGACSSVGAGEGSGRRGVCAVRYGERSERADTLPSL